MSNNLKSRWLKFAEINIIPRPDELWEAIESLYSESTRHYHNLTHIADCLEKLDQWPAHVPQKNEIELALWFHDIIYDSRRADNEESSAAILTHYLRGHHLESHTCALILATQHKETGGMEAEEIMCDIDLSILGAIKENKYLRYAKQIRKEYEWVDRERYTESRINVLERFLARKQLYHTKYAQGRWEAQAKINIEEERKALLSGDFL